MSAQRIIMGVAFAVMLYGAMRRQQDQVGSNIVACAGIVVAIAAVWQ